MLRMPHLDAVGVRYRLTVLGFDRPCPPRRRGPAVLSTLSRRAG
jgi:hypothetical protein